MTARWLRNASAAAFLCAAFFPSLALAQQEPATPTLQETANYILTNVEGGGGSQISWDKSTVTITARTKTTTFDVMNLLASQEKGVDSFYVWCLGGNFCLNVYDSKQGTSSDLNQMKIVCVNATICPNVLNAFNHFIKLLKQQNINPNDPFAPK